MASKLYVGNLPYTTNDAQLKEFFSQAGEVAEATVLSDRDTGRSRGFGFVTMAADEGTQKALELNGQEFEGRKLVVNEARPREDRPARRSSFGGGGDRY